MGYSMDLFGSTVDEEFICSICKDVMKDPTMTQDCSHVFCCACITTWMSSSANATCPIDRTPIKHKLVDPFRIYMNMYHRLQLKCTFEGCEHMSTLGQIEHHIKECNMNPANRQIIKPCAGNCGAWIKNKDVGKHSCVEYLKEQVQKKNTELDQLKQQLIAMQIQIAKDSTSDMLSKQVGKDLMVVQPGNSTNNGFTKGIKHFYIDVEKQTRKCKLDALSHLCDSLSKTRAIILCNTWGGASVSLKFRMKREKRHRLIFATSPKMKLEECLVVIQRFWRSSNGILITNIDWSSLGIDVVHWMNSNFLIIYYELPGNVENYFHRIGFGMGGGRSVFKVGNKGPVISLVTKEDQATLKEIEKWHNIEIVEMPSDLPESL